MTKLLPNLPAFTFGKFESKEELLSRWDHQQTLLPLLDYHPTFRVLIPLDQASNPNLLERCLTSLLAQSYPHWEAILVPRQSGTNAYETISEKIKDPRLIKLSPKASLLDAVLKQPGWTGVLYPEEALSPILLFEMAKKAGRKQGCLYTNELYLDKKQRVTAFLSKPNASWFNLIHFNYVGHFWCADNQSLRKCKQLRIFDEHSTLLDLFEQNCPFELLPLYGCYRPNEKNRKETTPTSRRVKLIEHESAPQKIRAPRNESKSLISVVIPFKDHAAWTIRCLQSLQKQIGNTPVETILINNRSTPSELKAIEAFLEKSSLPTQLINDNRPFNYSALNNRAIQKCANGNLILLLNNDVFLHGTKILDPWAAWTQEAWTGTVGIRLHLPDQSIQHGGFRAVFGGLHRMARLQHAKDERDFLHQNREVFGNSFAACMFRKEIFDRIGGLNEIDYPNGYSDVAFNFECLRLNLHNIYLGELSATHQESGSRGLSYEYWEEYQIEQQFPDILQRMLREDLGFNRIPSRQLSLKTLLQSGVAGTLFSKVPWLDPLRIPLKKMLAKNFS